MKSLNIRMTAALAGAALALGCSQQPETEIADFSAQARAAAEAAGYVPPGSSPELHIYTWCDYFSPDVIRSFEKALGCSVVIDTFDSNEAMYAKIKAGGAGYDLITPSSYQVAQMAKEKMILPLDHKKLTVVLRNFDPRFTSQILDPKFTYNVPYAVTYTGFACLKSKIPEGTDCATWAVLGNPALKGRISLLDDIREVIGGGLMYLGYGVNSTNPKELDAAVAQILKWRVNVRKFDGESYKTEVPNGSTWFGHGYSTDTTQVIVGDEESGAPARDDIAFILPREGFSIAFDEFTLSAGSKNRDLAYAFMNYMYMAEVAAANMEYICGPNPVKPGIELLEPDYRKLIILDEATLKRGQVLKGFADNPGAMDLYNRAWDRIKATEAR